MKRNRLIFLLGWVLVMVGGTEIISHAQPADKTQHPAAANENAKALSPSSRASSIRWITSYTEGRKLARKEKRPVLLDFRADWCPPCRLMERQTFSDPQIQQLLKQFACVQVDIDKENEVALAWRVSSIPRLILLNVHDQVIGDYLGFHPSDELAPLLEEALKHAEEKLAEGATSPSVAVPDEETLPEQIAAATGDAFASATIKMVSLPDPVARREALESVRSHADRLRPVLQQLLGHEHLSVRVGAMEALGMLGMPAAFDPWAEHPKRTEAAARLLRDSDSRAVERLPTEGKSSLPAK